jgi:DNA-binding LacI/PurR family transcriptional regulator
MRETFQADRTVADRVALHVRDLIATGALKRGAALPSYRELAAELGVATRTAKRGVDALTAQGIVRRQLRQGCFVNRELPRAGRPLHTIGIVHVASQKYLFSAPYLIQIMQGINDGSQPRDVHIFTMREHGFVTAAQLADRQVDGAILLGVESDAFLREFATWGVPGVVADQCCEDAPLDSVVCDNERGARLAVRQLLERGHRHIRSLGANPDRTFLVGYNRDVPLKTHSTDYTERRAAARRILSAAAGVRWDEVILSGDAQGKVQAQPDEANAIVAAWLREPDRPSAFLTDSDTLAESVVRALAGCGVAVPRDVSVCSAAGAGVAGPDAPLVAQSRFDFVGMGRKALELLRLRCEEPASAPAPAVYRIGCQFESGTTLAAAGTGQRKREEATMKTGRQVTLTLAVALALLGGLAPRAVGQGATGGTITQDGSVWVHTFTNSGNFAVTQQILNVEILVVGGGGAGGGNGGSTGVGQGGGGGGDFVTNSYAQLAAQTITVVVGTGGVGLVSTVNPAQSTGPNGSSSSATIVSPSTTITAIGGGGGGDRSAYSSTAPGQSGASGGGGAGVYSAGTSGLGGSATGIKGNAGGNGATSSNGGGGGGGGAGTTGPAATTQHGAAGGAGVTWHGQTYASGGGGGAKKSGGSGGTGGTNAGNGGTSTGSGSNGGDATANYGGGGGGSSGGNFRGGNGGSGVVIFRYEVGSGAVSPLTQNNPVSGVGTTKATLNGALTDIGTPSASAVFVLWGQNPNAWANTNFWTGGGWTNNTPFSTNITAGIAADGNYYYTFAASNSSLTGTASPAQYFITGEIGLSSSDSTCDANAADTAVITVARPSACTNGPLTINYALSGSGTNYVSAGPASGFSLAAGQASTNIVFTPVRPNAGAPVNATLTLLAGAYPSDALASFSVTVATAVSTSLTASNDTQIGNALNVIETPPTTVACSVAGSTYTYDFWTSSLNLNGKRIYYAGTRNLVLANLGALTDSGTGWIDTSSSANYTAGGGVTVQAPGGIAINGTNASGYAIDAASTAGPGLGANGGSVSLVATGGVALTAGGIRTLSAGNPGGSISITDGAGGSAGNVNIAGSLDARSAYSSTPLTANAVTVRGAAVAISNSVLAIQSGGYNNGGAVTLVASGPLTIGGYVAAQSTNPGYSGSGGAVTLTGATVTVSGTTNGIGIGTWCATNYVGNVAGDIRVTATAGDLSLAGGVDAWHTNTAQRGVVVLSAPNGRITVGSLDASRFKTLSLQAAASQTIRVIGALSNFAVSESPKKFTFPTNCVVGNDIIYNAASNTVVPLTGNYAIYVANTDTGKKLKQQMPQGTVVFFQ